MPKIIDSAVGSVGADGDDGGGVGICESLDHPHAETDGEAGFVIVRLQGAVPPGCVDADRPHLHTMLDRVPDDLRRRIEPHRLGVEERRAEHVRMPALQPGRGIGDQRKRRGMAFGEAVGAESFQLREGLLGKSLVVAAIDHSLDELGFEGTNPRP